MTETERLTVLYGDPALAPPERFPLRAGPLSLVYTADGDLRYIRWGRHEILRRLYFAVRDDAWDTVSAQITEIERTIGAGTFRIAYETRCMSAKKGIDFRATVTLSGDEGGTITFDFEGEALSSFQRNRIGICGLHPAQDCCGKPCRVRHNDGTEDHSSFPDLIAPHQPFFDIAALTHQVAPGVQATVTFEGEVFEMEDQRNWLDASFKTYSTPLDLPYPVLVPAGTRIHQTVTLRLAGPAALLPPALEEEPAVVTLGEEKHYRPWLLGLFLPPGEELLPEATVAPLTALKLDYFHYLVRADQDDWAEANRSGRKRAEQVAPHKVQLLAEVRNANHLPEDAPKAWFRNWLIEPYDPLTIKRAEKILPAYEGRFTFLGATASTNFTELNRVRPALTSKLKMVCYAANPQVHAFDALSIMETPPVLAETLRTAASFTPEKIFRGVGPLTFYGPYQSEDPRQCSQFAAAWYLAALAYAMGAGANYVTLCEPFGPRGLMSAQGDLYPIYHAIRSWRDHSGWLVDANTSAPLRLACLAQTYFNPSTDEGTLYAWVVNLTDAEERVTLQGLRAEDAMVSFLDETTPDGFSAPVPLLVPGGEVDLALRPYAVALVASRAMRLFTGHKVDTIEKLAGEL